MKRVLRGAALAVLVGAAACGGGQTGLNLFSTNWTDDGGRSIEEVRAKLKGAKPALGADVVVGVAGNADKLIGQTLGEGGTTWTFAHPIDARPILTNDRVIGSGGGEVFALEARTGTRLWARPTGGLKLHGAGDDGAVTVVTLERGAGQGSVLLAVLRDGSVVRQIETDKVLGAPAVLGGYAFVPWDGVYVSALDLANGNEAARVVVREKTSRAWTEGGAMYFGELGIFRWDDRIKDAPRNGASHLTVPVRELPGSPKLMTPGSENPGPAALAPDKIRVYARPSGGEGALVVDADRYYATYFRLVLGFEATHGDLAWVHTNESDVLGGAAGAGSLVTCDADGHVTVLDGKTGGVAARQDLGEPLQSCVVQVEAYHAAAAPKPMPPLTKQIEAALENGDTELVTAQRLLLRELATQKDEEATKTLVDLAENPRTAPALLEDARTALADRRSGARYMLAALGRHYDFLKDVLRPPPVGPIAQALAAMHERAAAPLLAEHLVDPADTDDDVRRAADAMVPLAGPAEVPRMRQFFGMYRASAKSDEVALGVASVGQALLKVGGAEGRALVTFAADDPMTRDDVRERLKVALERSAPPPAAGDAGAR